MTDRTAEPRNDPEKIRTIGRAGYKLTDEAYHRRWLARIKSKVKIDANGCWIWQGTRSINGYGQTQYRGKNKVLHRKVYEVVHGVTLDRWVYACHTCDVKLCCNPDHLWPGTPKENIQDSMAKGRHVNPISPWMRRKNEKRA